MIAGLDLVKVLQERGAVLDGHFLLSSGRHSDRFVQKFRVLEDPALLEPIARAIAASFSGENASVVVSAAVGGILLGYEVARTLGTHAIFVEKEAGKPVLRRGFKLGPADRALVVEDVITTGLSVHEVLEVVRASGAHAIGVGAMVRRGPADFGVPLHALVDLPLRSYSPEECPQCAAGVPLSDPGSRRAGSSGS
jgi:orotate phosphoribosyltransferase